MFPCLRFFVSLFCLPLSLYQSLSVFHTLEIVVTFLVFLRKTNHCLPSVVYLTVFRSICIRSIRLSVSLCFVYILLFTASRANRKRHTHPFKVSRCAAGGGIQVGVATTAIAVKSNFVLVLPIFLFKSTKKFPPPLFLTSNEPVSRECTRSKATPLSLSFPPFL